jgi:hypothetical protein
MFAPYLDSNMMMYNYIEQVYDSSEKAKKANAEVAQAVQQALSNASTLAGSDIESLSSADSYWGVPPATGYWDRADPAEPLLAARALELAQREYMNTSVHAWHALAIAHQQNQGYLLPMSMVPIMIPMPMPMHAVTMSTASSEWAKYAKPSAADMKTSEGTASQQGDSSQTDEQSTTTTGENAARRLEDLLPGGRRATVSRDDLGRKVFVGGLNPSTTTGDLHEYFSKFGTVIDSSVITDAEKKQSRGFGFVEFEGRIPEGLLDMQHIIDQRRCGVREYCHTPAS